MIRFGDLTRLGKVMAVLVALAAVIIAVILIGRWADGLTAWLLWSDESRLERAAARADYAEVDAANRRTEVVWLEKQQADVAEATRVIVRTVEITERAQALSEGAADATVEIDPGRVDRLRDADRRVCELDTLACTAAAAPD
ncbi:hypothetical protein [Brevundimonas aveniformis]|uniref:hypothetical protein n=1 Tax=Brevundimonas aveniformis TaxID=370977 RepID=UPI000425257E|nr:hypothetical protein [Brevundimonas aveniformis]